MCMHTQLKTKCHKTALRRTDTPCCVPLCCLQWACRVGLGEGAGRDPLHRFHNPLLEFKKTRLKFLFTVSFVSLSLCFLNTDFILYKPLFHSCGCAAFLYLLFCNSTREGLSREWGLLSFCSVSRGCPFLYSITRLSVQGRNWGHLGSFLHGPAEPLHYANPNHSLSKRCGPKSGLCGWILSSRPPLSPLTSLSL